LKSTLAFLVDFLSLIFFGFIYSAFVLISWEYGVYNCFGKRVSSQNPFTSSNKIFQLTEHDEKYSSNRTEALF
jgi:hypothetical protein